MCCPRPRTTSRIRHCRSRSKGSRKKGYAAAASRQLISANSRMVMPSWQQSVEYRVRWMSLCILLVATICLHHALQTLKDDARAVCVTDESGQAVDEIGMGQKASEDGGYGLT